MTIQKRNIHLQIRILLLGGTNSNYPTLLLKCDMNLTKTYTTMVNVLCLIHEGIIDTIDCQTSHQNMYWKQLLVVLMPYTAARTLPSMTEVCHFLFQPTQLHLNQCLQGRLITNCLSLSSSVE